MNRGLAKFAPVSWTLGVFAVAAYASLALVENVYGVPIASGEFRFERPLAGLAVPALFGLWLLRKRLLKHDRPRLGVSRGALLARMPKGRKVAFLPLIGALRITAFVLLGVALMGPQSIHARDSADVDGIDIVLTLDLSLSMQATDIVPDRFTATQAVVDEFIRRRSNDRIGAVIFGRDAYTLLPLTIDHDALRTMVADLQLGFIDGRGTAIGNALGVALNRLRHSDARSKVVILLTDGESNSGNLSPEQAADFAKTMNVKVYTVLMGETDASQRQTSVDPFGRPSFEPGSFPINPELLRSMAQTTGGEAFRAGDRASLERSFHDILNRLERTTLEDAGRVYGELFPAFAGVAFVLLALEALLATLILRRYP